MSKNKELKSKSKKNKNNIMSDVHNDEKQNACQISENQDVESSDSETELKGTSEDSLNNTEEGYIDKEIEHSLKSVNGSDEDETATENETVAERKVQSLSFLEKIGCMLAKKHVASLRQQIEDVKVECQEKQTELETEHNKLTEQISDLINIIDKKNKEIDSLAEAKKALLADKQELETENTILKSEKDVLESKNQTLTNKIEQLESIKKDLEESIKSNEVGSEKRLKEVQDDRKRILERIKSEFKDIITAMTIEEAITELVKALIKCKEQIESAKKDVKEAKEKNNEMEIRLQDAELRVKDIESSDNGKLTLELESTKHDLEENKSLLAQKESEFANFKEKDYCNLKKEKEIVEEKIKESQKLLENEKNAHKESVSKLNDENERIKEEHKASIIRLKEEHKVALEKKDNEHSEKVDKIRQDNAEKEKQAEDRHSKEVASLKEIAANKEKELNAKIKTKEDEIAALKTTLQNESDSLRNKTIDVITGLHEFLKSNEIMAACSDDYRDKAEEKLQDLIFNSQEMMHDISRLPQVQTPSEWETTLKSYIVDRIEENTSLINILLKYYTLSNVPFMIDAERNNGLYFIRKNIKYAYDAIVTILKQCNITPILPTLFVENINEGLYEVEGQFNDIESFCPGSINEHIEYVERGSEGLNGIIIGITRVGYLIGDEKRIKAQVLIS